MNHAFKIGAFAVIFDEQGRVLLSHRTDMDLWNLPGGTMELGETPWETVTREVTEETGLTAEIIRLTGIYSKPDKDDIVFCFACRITGGELTLSDEADQHGWFALDEMPLKTSTKHAERIRDAAANHSDVCLRRQVGPSSRELIAAGKL